MKKSDIAMLILIAAVAAGIAYFVAHAIFGNMSEKVQTVKTIEPITSQVEAPDSKIFNENAINPSVEVNIDNSVPATSTSANTPTAETAAPTE